MYKFDVEDIETIEDLIAVLKEEQQEEMKADLAAVKQAFEDRQHYMKGFDPGFEEPPAQIKDLIKKRGQEWQDSLKTLRKAYEQGLAEERKQAAQEQQSFQQWLLAQPAKAGYKWLHYPYDYFQWSYTYPPNEPHNVAKYTPITWPNIKDKDADWQCTQFQVEVEAVPPWVPQKEWVGHRAMVRIGGYYLIPGSLIKSAGMLDIAPINHVSGTIAAQAPPNTMDSTKFTAEVEIREAYITVGNSYGKPGGGFLGSHYRTVLKKGGANAWFKEPVSYYTWPKLYESGSSIPVVPGVDVMVISYMDFICDATGIPCGSFIEVKVESSGLLIKLP